MVALSRIQLENLRGLHNPTNNVGVTASTGFGLRHLIGKVQSGECIQKENNHPCPSCSIREHVRVLTKLTFMVKGYLSISYL